MSNRMSVNTILATVGIMMILLPTYLLVVPLEQTVDDHQTVTYEMAGKRITADVHVGHFILPTERGHALFSMPRFAEPDDCIERMAETIRDETGYEGYALVQFVHRLVYSIEYVTDMEATGYAENWSTPCETLINGYGDCEDHAILFVSLCTALGFDCIFLFEPEHVSAAVYVDGYGTKVEYGGREYLYCDTVTDSRPGRSTPEEYHIMPMGWCWIDTFVVSISLAVVAYFVCLWISCYREERD